MRIKPKDKKTLLQALKAGVVPRVGLQHIQVGRDQELSELKSDIDFIADGGSSFRVIVGEYGAGKTFLLNLTRAMALEKGLLVVSADLSPERRLYSSDGHAQSLFSELMRNMSSRSKVDGGALSSVVERFVADFLNDSDNPVEEVAERLRPLQELVSGFDFTKVVQHYTQSLLEGDKDGQANAMRWLRAEYTTKTETRSDLGIRTYVGDEDFYDYLKLYSQFAKRAGYKGLLVVLDEMVNLYKLSHTQSRNNNYEQILRILNDTLQGSAENIGFVLGGTPEFLMDTRKGLYSYEALQSRLAENSFSGKVDGVRDISGPVIRLQNLSVEEIFVLMSNVRHIFAGGDEAAYLIPDEGIHAYLEHCKNRLGNDYFMTPRNSLKGFVDLLSIIEQSEGKDWTDFISKVQLSKQSDGDPNKSDKKKDDTGQGELEELEEFTI